MIMRRFILAVSLALVVTIMMNASARTDSADVQHPVFDPGATEGQRASLESQLAPLLEMSDEELAALVPERQVVRMRMAEHGCGKRTPAPGRPGRGGPGIKPQAIPMCCAGR